MHIKELKALILIIQYGTVSQVAQILQMTQPGVSRLLKSLEDKVPRKLFYRRNNKLEPTQHALQLAEQATPLLQELDVLIDQYSRTQNTDDTCINIIVPNVVIYILSEILDQMNQDGIPVHMHLTPKTSTEVIAEMGKGFHLGLISHNIPISGDLRILPLVRSLICCIVHRDSPLSKNSILSPKMIVEHKIIYAFHRNSEETRIIKQIFRHLTAQTIPFYKTDTHMACELVSRNMGVGFVSSVIAGILIDKNPNIIAIPFTETLYQTLNWVLPSHPQLHPKITQIMTYTEAIVDKYQDITKCG